MEKINEEAEERFNKWLERTPNGRVAMAYDAWNEQQKVIDSLQAECLKYREALEFYANSENYCCLIKASTDGHPFNDLCPVLKDDGSKSREALKK